MARGHKSRKERRKNLFLVFLRNHWKQFGCITSSFSLLTSSALWRCCGMVQVKNLLARQQCCSSPSNNFLSMLNLLIILLFCFPVFCKVFCTGLSLSGCNFIQMLWYFFIQSSREIQLAITEQQERKRHEAQPLFSFWLSYHNVCYLPGSTL